MKNDKNSHPVTPSGTTAQPQQTVQDNHNRKGCWQRYERISYEGWLVKYRPMKNPFDSRAPYDGLMFETYGAELDFVRRQPENNIWTLVEAEGQIFIYEGFHYVNRLGYFVTEVGAFQGSVFSIKAD